MKSIVAIGGLNFGSFLTQQEATKIIHLGIDHGIDLIDTAPLYGNNQSEVLIGKAIEKISNPPRIATKVGLLATKNSAGQFGVKNDRLIKKNIHDSVNRSLKNLRRDQIDILTLHAFDKSTPLEETIQAVDELIQQGKVKYISCSNFNPDQLLKLIHCCNAVSIPLNSAQVHYNVIERRADNKFIKICETNKMQLHINRALARGALSGKYINGIPIDSRAYNSPRIKKWLTPERMSIIEKLNEICNKYEYSLVDLAVMWIKNQYSDTRIILGVRNPDQLFKLIKSSGLKLNSDLLNEIDVYLQAFKFILLSPLNYLEK
ncbi:aldo/keto reductase [Alphaproteobacteria bacterium]|nr:aldo/keto reductase [Alphaproteobacteria bacterium]